MPAQRFWKWLNRVFVGVVGIGGLILLGGVPCQAIVVNPSKKDVEEAVQRGKEAAQKKIPPSQLFWHFGDQADFQPRGFLMTKIGGLAVMATHYALRGEDPTHEAIQRVVQEKELQVIVTVFGETPTFAQESYLIMEQGGRVIKPERIRADGRATSIAQYTGNLAFRAKIVASFPYPSFEPSSLTRIKVFPGAGGEVSFSIDLALVP